MRKLFIIAMAWFLASLSHSVMAQALWTYPESYVVEQGDTLPLYISSESGAVSLEVRRVGSPWETVLTLDSISASEKTLPFEPWKNPPSWSPETEIKIDENWPSGMYRFTFKESNDSSKKQEWYITVKEDHPGSTSKTLVLDMLTTELAYSNLAGKSLYTFNSSGGITESGKPHAAKMTFKQPINFTQHWNLIKYLGWSENQGIPYEMASVMDLEENPSLIDHYDLVVIVGHNEYWSWDMRETFDNYLDQGGNAMILSGNTMWWQVRLEDGKLVCYKGTDADPISQTNQSHLTTVNWINEIVDYPENSTIGVSFDNAGYHNYDGMFLAAPGSKNGGYIVRKSDHWVFEGTGLSNDSVFGVEHTVVGYETDGALFDIENGVYLPTGVDGSPTDMEILATAQAFFHEPGFATMVLFRKGGAGGQGGLVFNAATTDWAQGLFTNGDEIADQQVSRITKNVFDRLSVRQNGESLEDQVSGEDNEEVVPVPETPNPVPFPEGEIIVTPEPEASGSSGGTLWLSLSFLLIMLARRSLSLR